MWNFYIDRNMKKNYITPAMITVVANASKMCAVSLIVDPEPGEGMEGDAKGSSMWSAMEDED